MPSFEVLSFDKISRIPVQGFYAGYISREANTIDYSLPKNEIRRYEKKLIASCTKADADKIFFLDQEHSDKIIYTKDPIDADSYCVGIADAMITNCRGFCLVIRTADCVPVVIVDPIKKTAAAVHSGWRSSELGIAGKTVARMNNEFKSNPSDCCAYILPSIGPDSYQVSRDVAEKFPGCYSLTEKGYYLDLWCSVEKSLEQAGIKKENIFNNRDCTYQHNNRFFSHRRGDIGRTLNFVVIE